MLLRMKESMAPSNDRDNASFSQRRVAGIAQVATGSRKERLLEKLSAEILICCCCCSDVTKLLASLRLLNKLMTKTPMDELQPLMSTIFSSLRKAVNHHVLVVRKVAVLVRPASSCLHL